MNAAFPGSLRLLRATLVLALFFAHGAFAASGFISGAQITRNASDAEISIRLACVVQYVDHFPADRGERLRIVLQPTGVCSNAAPTIAGSRQQYRPLAADEASLVELDYEGDAAGGPLLTLVFSDPVHFDLLSTGPSAEIRVRVHLDESAAAAAKASSGATGVRVRRQPEVDSPYVINLSSSRRPHAASDIPALTVPSGTRLYQSEIELAGVTWYRLRLGPFTSTGDAEGELRKLRDRFPAAWIGRDTGGGDSAVTTSVATDATEAPFKSSNSALASIGLDRIDELMNDARLAMVAGERSRAVQIYTKVLQVPNHDRHPEALEYLALAREKAGQTAHAKAEYQRYLSLYPDGEGAARVSQRLAALVASGRQSEKVAESSADTATRGRARSGTWRIQSFFSQYYRRDVNQQNDQDEIISQSALYSDMNLDARRRGERFDFSSRLSAGYRNEFLSDDRGSGDALRISYAYADLADAETGFRGRIGRQSRNTGGVLGRFDGLNLGYQISERVLLASVAGRPVYSASESIDSTRSFYGMSLSYGPVLGNLEIGTFYIEQDIEGIRDRQAAGAEFRYFGVDQSLWGMIDYDLAYKELASAFLQASWRFASRLSIHGSADRRGSPLLSTGNAIVGQPVTSFAELALIFTEEELRQLGRDRTSTSTTYNLGLSYPLTPRLQMNVDASQTTMAGTPSSGGILATPDMSYSYYSGNLVISSLLREGDVSIIGMRYSDSDTSTLVSMTLDSRFPIGRKWRLNPRLRIDRRHITADLSHEWLYTPGMRIQYRRSKRFRLEMETGKQFSQRDMNGAELQRQSWFINLGYQAYF